jgi:hypothetical protein
VLPRQEDDVSGEIIPDMPENSKSAYQLTLEIKAEYLLSRATGTRTRAAVSALLTEISTAAIEHRSGKVLVDVRELDGLLSILDSYMIVRDDFQSFRGKGISKVAIVDRPHPELREWFFELVARNRGYNLKIFTDPAVALEWLLG